jgi:hypothetical protein
MSKLNMVADGLEDNPTEGTRVNVCLQDFCCTAARQSNGSGGKTLDSKQHTFSAREADGLRADKFEYSTPLKPVLNFFWTTCEPSAKLLQLWMDTPERIDAATWYNGKTKKDEPLFPCSAITMLTRTNCSSTNENWLSAKEQGVASKRVNGQPIISATERPYETASVKTADGVVTAGKQFFHLHSGTFSSAANDASSVSDQIQRVIETAKSQIQVCVTNLQYQLRHK